VTAPRHGLVWVVTESAGGRVLPGGLGVLAWAAGVATSVEAVHWGPDAGPVAAAVGRHGVRRLLAVGDLGGALPGVPVAAALAARIAGGDCPDALLFTASRDQREVAGRLSARLDRPVVAGAVGGPPPDGGTPQLVMLHPRFPAPPAPPPAEGGGEAAAVVSLAVPDDGRPAARVQRRGRPGGSGLGPSLDGAPVVVVAGRGLGPEDRFAQVEELARLLRGAAAATGAAVDAGWAPAGALVGQGGRTVAPAVYLAFGVSGASQHLAGVRGAGTVVAVDTDPTTPLMARADLAVVGDAPSILSRLLAALSSR
jgi:electron transfer flavoprotein alpha subunit